MPWIMSNATYANAPYILLSVSFAKMDRVVSAESTAFLTAAVPTRNRVCYFNHRTLETFIVSVALEATVPSMSSTSWWATLSRHLQYIHGFNL
jgi:hypothetical protein